MAKKPRGIVGIFLVVAMALSLCGISALANESPPPSVSIDQGETADVTYPDTLQLTAQHSGFHSAEGGCTHDYGDIAYSWSSGDTGVATVDTGGLVSGVTPGTADVTVTATQMVRTLEWHGCGWGWSDWSIYATATDTIAVTVLEPVDVVTITVTDGTNPVEGAHVKLLGPTSPMPEGDTGANGQISFTESVIGYYDHSNTTVYDVVVTKAGYVDGSGDVRVTDDWYVEGQWYFGDEDQYGYGNATIVLTASQQEPPTTSFAVFKEWSDSETVEHDNATVQVRLLADGTPVEGETVFLDQYGEYYWNSLPMYNDEELIVYTVAEVNVPSNYSASYTYDYTSENMHERPFALITNTYSPPYNPPVIATYYKLTVNWVDGEGAPLADPVTKSYIAGTPYDTDDIEGGSGRTFEGYTYSALAEGSDDPSGYMSGNKTVTFVYAADEITPEETPPVDPEPTEEIPDDEVPVDDSPETGDHAPLALLWLAFCISLSGLIVLAVTAPGKRREGSR